MVKKPVKRQPGQIRYCKQYKLVMKAPKKFIDLYAAVTPTKERTPSRYDYSDVYAGKMKSPDVSRIEE